VRPIPLVPPSWLGFMVAIGTLTGMTTVLAFPLLAWNMLTTIRNRLRCPSPACADYIVFSQGKGIDRCRAGASSP